MGSESVGPAQKSELIEVGIEFSPIIKFGFRVGDEILNTRPANN